MSRSQAAWAATRIAAARMAVMAMALLVLGGCFSARPQVLRSFALAGPKVEAPREVAGAPVVRVRDLEPSAVVDRDVLVVRRSAVEFEMRDEHRWALRPHRMVAEILAHYLVDSGLFAAAPRTLGEGRPTLELAGRLDTLELDRSGKAPRVRLALLLTLRRFDDGEQLWSFRAARERACGEDVGGAVAAISALVGEVTVEAAEALRASGALAKAPAAGDEGGEADEHPSGKPAIELDKR
jgi:ABC-type uncharacterized transport system auxiliary subunit